MNSYSIRFIHWLFRVRNDTVKHRNRWDIYFKGYSTNNFLITILFLLRLLLYRSLTFFLEQSARCKPALAVTVSEELAAPCRASRGPFPDICCPTELVPRWTPGHSPAGHRTHKCQSWPAVWGKSHSSEYLQVAGNNFNLSMHKKVYLFLHLRAHVHTCRRHILLSAVSQTRTCMYSSQRQVQQVAKTSTRHLYLCRPLGFPHLPRHKPLSTWP